MDTADTLSESLPVVSDGAIQARARRLLRGRAGELTALHGERDLNFLVTNRRASAPILKVHNPAESTA